MGLFATILKKHKVQAYQPKGIITSAEMLKPEDRTLIEDVFGCKVFNRLGCREFAVIASECEQHDGLHIMQEGFYIEILKQGKHAAPGELGELVMTDMLNWPMPLIRYRIGDSAAWMDGTCSCGRGLARITNVSGRVTGFLVAVDGTLCSGVVLATMIISHRPSLRQVQILQTEKGKITYKIACGAEENFREEDRNYLREKTSLYLGKESRYPLCRRIGGSQL
jgi:phenylacetate-CoA ligase